MIMFRFRALLSDARKFGVAIMTEGFSSRPYGSVMAFDLSPFGTAFGMLAELLDGCGRR